VIEDLVKTIPGRTVREIAVVLDQTVRQAQTDIASMMQERTPKLGKGRKRRRARCHAR
jgi:hypothetical protein